jgi:hypothetical protein
MPRRTCGLPAGLVLAVASLQPVASQGMPVPRVRPPVKRSPSAASSAPELRRLQAVVVAATRLSLIGNATTASQGVVVNSEITLTPAYRPGQALETVPGLDVTTHSGEGKANQYLMRGYNLDHGTDLAVYVDDMPINEPTHAHGQGYADINFMIPELATNISYTKGTYYADEGDFASVGSVHIDFLNSIPDQVSATVGTMDFQRYLLAGSTGTDDGNLLGAVAVQHYDGPWTVPGDQREASSVVRYSSGDAQQGYSLTAMFYHDLWNAQTDVPERALIGALISSRWSELEPADAGYAQRSSLSWAYHDDVGGGQLRANAYVTSNHLTLWNDFTHFLVDPIDGDQEGQHEDRVTVGGDTSYVWTEQFGDVDNEWLAGVHTRYDFNDVSRIPTENGIPLTSEQLTAVDYPRYFSESDTVRLSSVASYVQVTTHWTDWFRTVLGFREDYMYGSDVGTWSGTASRALPQPKASLIFRASKNTELYASYGVGFHSDDLRGVNQAKILHEPGAPLTASQTGEELGLRQNLLDRRIALTVALYSLRAQSETTYDPDVGQDAAGPGSIRRGFEVNVTYQVLPWLELYGSYSGDRARYTTPYDDGTGHLGEYLPNAPFATGQFNLYVRNLGPWSGGLEYRYLGAFPLTSGPCNDVAVATAFGSGLTCANAPTAKGMVFGSGYGEWSADVHYAIGHGWSAGLGLFNLLNTKANTMEYYYIDRLPGEPRYGEAGLHFHPMEPFAARLTIARTF